MSRFRNLVYTILGIVIVDLTNIIETETQRNMLSQFEQNTTDMLNYFVYGFTDLEKIIPSTVFLQTAFFMLIPLFFGQSISSELNISAAYYFTRQTNKTKWYVKKCTYVMLYSVIISLFVFLYEMAIIYHYSSSLPDTSMLLAMYCGIFMYVFFFIMAANLISIFFGSITSVIVTCVVHILNIVCLKIKVGTFYLSLLTNSVILSEDSANTITLKLLTCAASVLVIIIAEGIVINKKELSLVNAEQIF